MKTTIASPDNKFYKILRKLDKKKYRDKNNIFKAEGEKFLKEKINFTKIIIKESKYEYLENKYKITQFNNLTILKDDLFDEISEQENSQGVIVLYSKNMLRLRPSLGSSRFPARQEMYVSTYSLQNVARTG